MSMSVLPVRIGMLALALGSALPVAMAQQMDHSKMSMPMEVPPPGAQTPAVETPTDARPAAPKEQAGPAATPSHAGHQRPAGSGSSAPAVDHAAMGHDAPMQGMDHSAMGQDMGTVPGRAPQPMAGSDHPQPGHAGMSMAPATPRTPIPALTEADRAAAVPPSMVHATTDNAIHSYSLLNRLEAWDADPGTALAWEGEGWIGTDLDRFWWRTEGQRSDGRTESADLELLYGRSVSRWWDLVAGVRHDFKPGQSQSFAAIGVQGLAPQKFQVRATAYLGEEGQSAARVEGEYELLLSNRLILQPRLEATAWGKGDASRGIGSGLATAELGLRLRYEFTRRFAPYVGLVHERAFGNTAELRRDAAEPRDDTRIVVGLRTWF